MLRANTYTYTRWRMSEANVRMSSLMDDKVRLRTISLHSIIMDLGIDVAKYMYQRVQYIISYAEEPHVYRDSSHEILTCKERKSIVSLYCNISIFKLTPSQLDLKWKFD